MDRSVVFSTFESWFLRGLFTKNYIKGIKIIYFDWLINQIMQFMNYILCSNCTSSSAMHLWHQLRTIWQVMFWKNCGFVRRMEKLDITCCGGKYFILDYSIYGENLCWILSFLFNRQTRYSGRIGTWSPKYWKSLKISKPLRLRIIFKFAL